MRKKVVVFVFVLSGIGLLAWLGYGLTSGRAADAAIENAAPSVTAKAERVEVVHFHATQQCHSCRKVGELAFRTVKERFPAEWRDGIVRFVDVNGELPENRETVVKYQATGSSLFLNGIAGGKDRIQEDVTVWRLISNEQKYMDYLEGQIRDLLDKGV